MRLALFLLRVRGPSWPRGRATVVADISERTRRLLVHRDDALPGPAGECMPGIAHAPMRAHSAATGRHLCTHLPSDVPGLA